MTDSLATDRLARVAKALASPVRLQILQTLGARGTCVCGDVVDALGLAQSTTSQHLKILREAGLVCSDADGTKTCFCLDAAGIARSRDAFAALLGGLESCCGTDACCCGSGACSCGNASRPSSAA